MNQVDTVKTVRRYVSNQGMLKKIVSVVAKEFLIDDVEKLKGPSRICSRRYLLQRARLALFYLVQKHSGLSSVELAEALRCNRATVLQGAIRARNQLSTEDSFRKSIDHIEGLLGVREDDCALELQQIARRLTQLAVELNELENNLQKIITNKARRIR